MKVEMKETEYYKSGRHTANAKLARSKATKISAENAKNRRERLTDEYLATPKICKTCLSIVPYSKRNGIFCSSSCAAKHNNKVRILPPPNEKQVNCCRCQLQFMAKANASNTKSLCRECKKVNHNEKAKLWRKTDGNKKWIVCKICGTHSFVSKSSKTCGSQDCKVEASVGCRTYPNFRKKLCWFFNPYQNKNVLLESSWEVELAEFLTTNQIEWIRPKFIKWVDLQGTTRRYFPDFYLPKQNLYLDPKNPYAMKLGNSEEKMFAISKKVDIIYGNLETIKQEISNLCK